MKKLLAAVTLMIGFSACATQPSVESQIIEVTANETGFEPNVINVDASRPVILKVTRKTNETCATEIQIKSKNIDQPLPLNQTVDIDLGKLKKGDLKFSCAMNMMSGILHVK